MLITAIRRMLTHKGVAFVTAVLTVQPGFAAADLTLKFPSPAVETAQVNEPLSSYQIPIGPFHAGDIPTTRAEGRLAQAAWQLQSESLTTLDLLKPLREQIAAAGFSVIFECEAQSCGGFDFRFGTQNLEEPAMHVDLGDFRFLSAKRQGDAGNEYLSLLVSRSPQASYVQLTRIGNLEPPTPELTASTKTPGQSPGVSGNPAPAPVTEPTVLSAEGFATLGETLARGAPLVLEDLVFPSGAATLQPGDYASLAALAAWLQANPTQSVLLVGHTDASGGLSANVSLSRRRADSVRQVLLTDYGVASAQVRADGVGYLAPRAGNLDDDGRTKNRRVEVFLTSTP